MKTTIPWMYDGHRAAMQEAISQTPTVIRSGDLSGEYASALYLLTGLKNAWKWIQRYVYTYSNVIDHKAMLRLPSITIPEQYIIVVSNDLFGKDFLLLDDSLVGLATHLDDAMLYLALNGILLRHEEPTLAMLEEESNEEAGIVTTGYFPYNSEEKVMKTTIPWLYDGHREAMKEAILRIHAVNQSGDLSREYASALYLLTGLKDAWKRLQQYVYADSGEIDHDVMINLFSLRFAERNIISLSWDLFDHGGNRITASPAFLATQLDDTMLHLALNGILIRHNTITLAMLEEEGKEDTDIAITSCLPCNNAVTRCKGEKP